MKSRTRKLLAIGVAVPVLLVAAAQWWVGSRITAGSLIRNLEESRNCRVTVGKVAVRMFALPARVEVSDVKIIPRDESRKPASPGETFVHVDRMLLEVNIWNLLLGNLDVERALVDGVTMQTVKWAEGGNSLRLLLAKPGSDDRPARQPVTLEDADEIAPADAGDAGDEKPFHVSELPVTATLREARISNVAWTVQNRRRNTVQQFKDGNFVLTGMTIDPDDPSSGGSASVSVGTRLIIDNEQTRVRTVDFLMSLDGRFQLIDPDTGNLKNDLDFEFTVRRGSLINRIPTLVKLNERLAKLQSSIGLELELPAEATLTADTILRAQLSDGVIRTSADVFFPFDTYQLALEKDSWLSLRNEEHEFRGRLIAGGPISAKAVAGVKSFLENRGGALTEIVSRTVLDNVVNASGQVELPFRSSASISRPDVTLSEKFLNVLKRAGAEAGKDLLKDFLEGGDDLDSIIRAVKGKKKDP